MTTLGASLARAIARIAREPQGGQRVVHLRNPRPAHWNETVLWLDLNGHRVTLEPFAAWIERVRRETRDPGHPLRVGIDGRTAAGEVR